MKTIKNIFTAIAVCAALVIGAQKSEAQLDTYGLNSVVPLITPGLYTGTNQTTFTNLNYFIGQAGILVTENAGAGVTVTNPITILIISTNITTGPSGISYSLTTNSLALPATGMTNSTQWFPYDTTSYGGIVSVQYFIPATQTNVLSVSFVGRKKYQ